MNTTSTSMMATLTEIPAAGLILLKECVHCVCAVQENRQVTGYPDFFTKDPPFHTLRPSGTTWQYNALLVEAPAPQPCLVGLSSNRKLRSGSGVSRRVSL